MTERIFADKSKEDLLEIVRLTGVMNPAKAETLSRAELAAELESLYVAEQGEKTLSKSNLGKKATNRSKAKSIPKSQKKKIAAQPEVSELVAENTKETSSLQTTKRGRGRPRKTEAAVPTDLNLKPKFDIEAKQDRVLETNPEVLAENNSEVIVETKPEAADIVIKQEAPDDKKVKTPAENKKKPKLKTGRKSNVQEIISETDLKTDLISADSAMVEVEQDASEPPSVRKSAKESRSRKLKNKKAPKTVSEEANTVVEVAATEEKTATPAEPVVEQISADSEKETVGIPTESISLTTQTTNNQVTLQEQLTTGVLEILPDGYGFLRCENYLPGNKDVYVPPQFVRRFNLRPGDLISGPSRVQRDNGSQAIFFIKSINGMPPDRSIRRPRFDKLVPIYPNERFKLETGRNELSTRIIDLIAPIGKGQRGMIVSPPKAGKTILLQKIANAISANNPEAKLLVLLIDERPEEVTDMQRSIQGEVVYSTFDKTPENHVKVAELVLERAMRLVELGEDVVILLDSITRLARAYNLSINPTGRTLSGGLDPGALYGPKRFFGAARNIENGGSLTIVATSLVETGSRMDEVIFEEFKGTGNMEIYLDRKLSEKRIFPALDLNRSGTRREELLLSSQELDSVWSIRKAFGQLDNMNVTEMIINLLLRTNTNDQFVSSINVSFNDKAIFESMRGQTVGNKNGANNTGNN